MKKIKPKIVAIVGPTASGKTAVSVKLAKKFNGEIVSADSRQIFRGLDLGTGKEGTPQSGEILNPNIEIRNHPARAGDPVRMRDKLKTQNSKLKTVEQLRRNLRYIDNIPQWVIDVASPEEEFNLFRYTELAKAAISDILSRGKLPIIVGGTGLYVQALVEGFNLKSEIRNPKSEKNSKFQTLPTGRQVPNSKQYDREELENMTVEKLQKTLKQIDSEAFEKLSDQKNPHRLLRAIERAQSGLTMTKVKPDWDILQIAINLPREVLNERIDKRVEDRFKAGMLEEVGGLIKSGVDPTWLLKLGLEYRIITSFLMSKSHPTGDQPEDDKFLISNKYNTNNVIPDLVGDPLIVDSRLRGNDEKRCGNDKKSYENNKEFDSMKEELKLRSHQYAKRQVTWFKRFPEILWLSDDIEIEKRVKEFI